MIIQNSKDAEIEPHRSVYVEESLPLFQRLMTMLCYQVSGVFELGKEAFCLKSRRQVCVQALFFKALSLTRDFLCSIKVAQTMQVLLVDARLESFVSKDNIIQVPPLAADSSILPSCCCSFTNRPSLPLSTRRWLSASKHCCSHQASCRLFP